MKFLIPLRTIQGWYMKVGHKERHSDPEYLQSPLSVRDNLKNLFRI